MRRLIITTIGVAFVCLTAVPGAFTVKSTKTKRVTEQTAPATGAVAQDPAGTIDGRTHPELISDHFAYLAIFRMISNRHSEAEMRNIRAYVTQVIGLGRQRNCQGCRPSTGDGDADIDALLAAAEEFYQRVKILDEQATSLKDATWPNPGPEVMIQLEQLQAQKDAIIAEISNSLQNRLSPGGSQRVREHINNYVKRGITLTLGPSTPPTGPGWHSAGSGHIPKLNIDRMWRKGLKGKS